MNNSKCDHLCECYKSKKLSPCVMSLTCLNCFIAKNGSEGRSSWPLCVWISIKAATAVYTLCNITLFLMIWLILMGPPFHTSRAPIRRVCVLWAVICSADMRTWWASYTIWDVTKCLVISEEIFFFSRRRRGDIAKNKSHYIILVSKTCLKESILLWQEP